MRSARYVRLYTDKRGETHFEDLELDLTPQEFAPPAPPLNIGQFLPAEGSFFIGAPGDWPGDALHPTPRRQLYCTVEGEYEITASDGEVRCFPAGSMLLIEDTSGEGHRTRITNSKGVLIFAVALADEDEGRRIS